MDALLQKSSLAGPSARIGRQTGRTFSRNPNRSPQLSRNRTCFSLDELEPNRRSHADQISMEPKNLTYTWKGHKKVKVLGAYSFFLDDKRTWHANQLKKWVRDSLALEQWIEQDSAPQRQAAPTPLRRSTRMTRGIPPQRYHDVYSFNRSSHACTSRLHAGDG